MRHVKMRPGSPALGVTPVSETTDAAHVPHPADMGRKMMTTVDDMGGKMRSAADVRRKVWSASPDMRGKMRSATDMRRKMRSASAHVRGTPANMGSPRVAASRPWRRRPRAGRTAQGQTKGANTRRQGSRLDHNVLPKCRRAKARAKPLPDQTVGYHNGSGGLVATVGRRDGRAGGPALRCMPSAASRSIAPKQLAMG